MPGRLNSFQKTMLQWNELHPYNAVHVVRIPQSLDLDALRAVIQYILEKASLTNLALNRRAGTYEYAGGAVSCDIQVLDPGQGIQSQLSAVIERELNTPFIPADRINPFRFFVLRDGSGFWLGLVYFHAVADAESIVFLLKRITEQYLNGAAPDASPPLDLYPALENGFLPAAKRIAKNLSALPEFLRNMRKSCRPRYGDPRQPSRNNFICFTLGPEKLQSLLSAAKAWDVTFNDLFLALLIRCFTPEAVKRREVSPDRPNISVGCIVNIRKDLGLEGGGTFGLFLGSFIVTQPIPDATGLKELARNVRRQTGDIKANQRYMGAPIELAFGRLMFSFFSTDRWRRLYQKHYPLWGGITNMNLNTLWPQPKDAPAMDYLRGVSTGPVTPLVLSITTAGDHVNIGLSYRDAVFWPGQIETMKNNLLSMLPSAEDYA